MSAYYKITFCHRGETQENTLYLPGDGAHCLISAALSISCGKAGELKLEIPAANPARDGLVCLTDEVVFYRNNVELFRGRPVTSQTDFDRTGTLECEGILAYLYDTWYPPYQFNGSPKDFLSSVIDSHNAMVDEQKRFYLGTVTVEDPNDYIARSNQDYSRSLSVLTDKLVNESLGGYLRARYQDGKRYLDYLDTYGGTASQMIQFGYNLLDIAVSIEYGNVVTAILPLGAEIQSEDGSNADSRERITVESVNGGSLYVSDAQAVSQYGWIADMVTWDDVTQPENLLKKAQDYLQTASSGIRTVTVRSVDMAQIEAGTASFFLGDAVRIVSTPHGVDLTAELTEMEIDPLHPEQNTLTFGTVERLSDIVHRNQSSAVTLVQAERKNRQTAMERLSKAISEGSGMYITPDEQPDGSEIYYLHDKKSLSESQYVIRVNSQSISFSTDGGATYPFGYTVDGALVMDIIEANGISADWVKFGSQTITEKINDLEETDSKNVETLRSELEVNSNNIRQEVSGAYATKDDLNSTKASLELSIDKKVGTDELISKINASADEINLTGDRIVISSTHFKLDADGTVTSVGGTISGAQIEGATGSFTGQLNANSGNVGSFTIMDGTLYSSAEHTVTGGSAVTVFTLNGNPALGEAGDGPPEIRFTGAYQGTPRSAAAWITVAGGAENSNGVTSFDRLELGASSGTKSGKLEVSSNGVYTNRSFSADNTITAGNSITTGNQIGFSGAYDDRNVGLFCRWADGNNHNMVDRSTDGLTAGVGWKGSADYKTVTNVRGQTVKVVNSSGTSTLSDERMKKDWKGLEGYDAFFDALNPRAFRYIDGSSGRYHLGFGAQSVEQALADSGLDNADFGGLIKYAVDLQSDDWRGYDQEYGLIYTEFVALLVDQVQRLKCRVDELERQNADMEQRLAALEKMMGG